MFGRFLPFSATMSNPCVVNHGEKPKTAETDQGLAGQAGTAVRSYTSAQADTVGLCRQQVKAGWKLLQIAKQISQHSPSPAEGLCV